MGLIYSLMRKMGPKVTCNSCKQRLPLLDFQSFGASSQEAFYRPTVHKLRCPRCGGITQYKIYSRQRRTSLY